MDFNDYGCPIPKLNHSFLRKLARLERFSSCLTNRRVRDPYARWCERCTPSLFRGGAAYSILRSLTDPFRGGKSVQGIVPERIAQALARSCAI